MPINCKIERWVVTYPFRHPDFCLYDLPCLSFRSGPTFIKTTVLVLCDAFYLFNAKVKQQFANCCGDLRTAAIFSHPIQQTVITFMTITPRMLK